MASLKQIVFKLSSASASIVSNVCGSIEAVGTTHLFLTRRCDPSLAPNRGCVSVSEDPKVGVGAVIWAQAELVSIESPSY